MKQKIIISVVPSLGFGGTERQGILLAKAIKERYVSYVFSLKNVEDMELEYWGLEKYDILDTRSDIEQVIADDQPVLMIFHNLIREIDSDFIDFINKLDVVVVEQSVFSQYDQRLNSEISLQLSRIAEVKYRSTAPSRHVTHLLPYSIDTAERKLVKRAPETERIYGRVGQPSMAKWSSKYSKIIRSTMESESCKWILVGCPENLKNKILAELPEIYLSRIEFIERITCRNELFGVLSKVTDFIHISNIGESFGYVLFEAMIAQCRVHVLDTPWVDNSQAEYVSQYSKGFVYGSTKQLLSSLKSDVRLSIADTDIEFYETFNLDRIKRSLFELIDRDFRTSQEAVVDLIFAPPSLYTRLYLLARILKKHKSHDFIDKAFAYVWRRVFWL